MGTSGFAGARNRGGHKVDHSGYVTLAPFGVGPVPPLRLSVNE